MGFFSKKPAPAPQANAAARCVQIAITGVGIACHAGDTSRALIGSILGQMSGVELSDAYTIKLRDGSDESVRVAPIAELAHQHAPQRMRSMSATAIGDAVANLPDSVQAESVLTIIMVPPELSDADKQRLQSYLIDGMRHLATATFRILPNSTSGTSALRNAIAELDQGKWQAVIFGGTDSLLSIDTCLDLYEQNRLNTANNGNGLIPGEAAAFIVLQSKNTAAANSSPALAWLGGLGIAAEPNARNADLQATEGLGTAIEQALAQTGITTPDIQGLIHNLCAETVQTIEWNQTAKKIWPRKVDEQQRMAVQLGEIEQPDIPDDPIPKTLHPCKTMGTTGAAALPMQLATALAWIEYDAHLAKWGFPVRQHLLVCDTPDAPERGAIVISKTPAAAT